MSGVKEATYLTNNRKIIVCWEKHTQKDNKGEDGSEEQDLGQQYVGS